MTQHSLFRASEVLDMAIQIEHAGMAFYRACGEADLHPRVGEVFLRLVALEQDHARLFERMKEDVGDYSLPLSYAGEMASHIKSFVKHRVFQEPEHAVHLAMQIRNPFEAIETALAFERKSILFYSSMKQVVPFSEQKIVDKVIAEEHKHIRHLLSLRRKVEAQNQNS